MTDARYAQLPGLELEERERTPSPSRTLADPHINNSDEAAATPLNSRASRPDSEPAIVSEHAHTLLKSKSDTELAVGEPPSRDRRSSSIFTTGIEKIYESFTPSQHQLLDGTRRSTVRKYDKRKQRRRLWQLTLGEWWLTLILCVSYFIVLYKYSHRDTLSPAQRRTFNALVTTNALFLGVNLSASLRSYAKMLRWRMLSTKYRPLETFDLVMGCDSLINVVKLIYKGGNKGKMMPSQTQAYAVLWLLINLAATFLVGVIGLTYNLDSSTAFVLTKHGNVEITDLSQILSDDLQQSLNAVNAWGIRGYGYRPICQYYNTFQYRGDYESCGEGLSRYFFVDWAVSRDHNVVSTRYLDTEAECEGYYVTEGGSGNLTTITYDTDALLVNKTLPFAPGSGSLTFISDNSNSCGDRCTYVDVFVARSTNRADPNAITSTTSPDDSLYFRCTNTVSNVTDWWTDLSTVFQFPDHQARILAGAIGWTGVPVPDTTLQFHTYPASSEIHFSDTPNSTEVASMISAFTTKSVAAMDTIYPGIARKTVAGKEPIDAQVLIVSWRWCGAILALLPFLHFWTMMAMIIWANKAVIKDDSHLAVSQAYWELLAGLKGTGCMLRGDEIVAMLGSPDVVYGFTEPGRAEGDAGHVGVFVEGSGVREERSFREGTFDGLRERKRRLVINRERGGG